MSYEDKAKVSKGLKINNAKSFVAKNVEEKKQSEEEFKQKAVELISEQKEINTKMFELSKAILASLKDNKLLENKTPSQLDVEKSNRLDITKLALEIDNDDSVTTLNMGTTSNLQVLFKGVFILRDKINDTMFELYMLKSQIESLEERVSKLEKS